MVSKVTSLLQTTRLGKFATVGAMGAVIDNVVLVLLVELAAVAPVWGAVVSKELSILAMFVLNDRWTFTEFDHGSTGRRLVKSNVLRLGGLIVGVVTLWILHDLFGVWYLAANLVGIGVGFVVNYLAESILTWRVLD